MNIKQFISKLEKMIGKSLYEIDMIEHFKNRNFGAYGVRYIIEDTIFMIRLNYKNSTLNLTELLSIDLFLGKKYPSYTIELINVDFNKCVHKIAYLIKSGRIEQNILAHDSFGAISHKQCLKEFLETWSSKRISKETFITKYGEDKEEIYEYVVAEELGKGYNIEEAYESILNKLPTIKMIVNGKKEKYISENSEHSKIPFKQSINHISDLISKLLNGDYNTLFLINQNKLNFNIDDDLKGKSFLEISKNEVKNFEDFKNILDNNNFDVFVFNNCDSLLREKNQEFIDFMKNNRGKKLNDKKIVGKLIFITNLSMSYIEKYECNKSLSYSITSSTFEQKEQVKDIIDYYNEDISAQDISKILSLIEAVDVVSLTRAIKIFKMGLNNTDKIISIYC